MAKTATPSVKVKPKVQAKAKSKKTKTKISKIKPKKDNSKTSDGRCPVGQHWVRTHPMRVPPSKKSPTGITIRRPHCARNPGYGRKLTNQEIKKTASSALFLSKTKPCSLKMEFKDGSKYDDLIAGWVKYWNDVFKPEQPLEPNLIKALIASESSFDHKKLADPKNPTSARGLMQLLDTSRKILDDEKGELRNHFISASREDLLDPNINICSGIRWLFHKKKLASGKLGRTANWEESVIEYKSLAKDLKAGNTKLLNRFKGYLRRLETCKK